MSIVGASGREDSADRPGFPRVSLWKGIFGIDRRGGAPVKQRASLQEAPVRPSGRRLT